MAKRILLTGLLSVAVMAFTTACHGAHGHHGEYCGDVSIQRTTTTTTTTSESVTPNPARDHGCHGGCHGGHHGGCHGGCGGGCHH